jgi:hypothetical protein
LSGERDSVGTAEGIDEAECSQNVETSTRRSKSK